MTRISDLQEGDKFSFIHKPKIVFTFMYRIFYQSKWQYKFYKEDPNDCYIRIDMEINKVT